MKGTKPPRPFRLAHSARHDNLEPLTEDKQTRSASRGSSRQTHANGFAQGSSLAAITIDENVDSIRR
jgi:hypothetical protein